MMIMWRKFTAVGSIFLPKAKSKEIPTMTYDLVTTTMEWEGSKEFDNSCWLLSKSISKWKCPRPIRLQQCMNVLRYLQAVLLMIMLINRQVLLKSSLQKYFHGHWTYLHFWGWGSCTIGAESNAMEWCGTKMFDSSTPWITKSMYKAFIGLTILAALVIVLLQFFTKVALK